MRSNMYAYHACNALPDPQQKMEPLIGIGKAICMHAMHVLMHAMHACLYCKECMKTNNQTYMQTLHYITL